jgi:hypothetical protein
VTATLKAGETVEVTFQGKARHGGGVCQFSVSYDNDNSFIVLEEIKGGCPEGIIPLINTLQPDLAGR